MGHDMLAYYDEGLVTVTVLTWGQQQFKTTQNKCLESLEYLHVHVIATPYQHDPCRNVNIY